MGDRKPKVDLNEFKGCWALVTGASGGIGKEFCLQLAAAGMDIVMVARRQSLLEQLAKELETTSKIRCLILPVDLAQPESIDKIKKTLQEKNIKIRLLVNNAALGFYGRFAEAPREFHQQMMNVNMLAVASLCLEFLNDLRSFPSSAMINISSQAALNPIPGSALYAATKAFVHSLSLALYYELKDTGVIVQTLIPGPTETESTQKSNSILKNIKHWGTCEEVVKTSLDHLKTAQPVVTTAKDFYVQKLFANLMPEQIVLRKVGAMFLR